MKFERTLIWFLLTKKSKMIIYSIWLQNSEIIFEWNQTENFIITRIQHFSFQNNQISQINSQKIIRIKSIKIKIKIHFFKIEAIFVIVIEKKITQILHFKKNNKFLNARAKNFIFILIAIISILLNVQSTEFLILKKSNESSKSWKISNSKHELIFLWKNVKIWFFSINENNRTW